MAWTFNISTYFGAAAAEISTVFGQLTFSGNYTVGGDAAGTITFGGNTINLPVYLQASSLHASRPPLIYQIQLDAGYIGLLISGTTATNFKLKIINTTTGNELGAGAYPAGLTAANLQHTMLLNYRSNI